MRLLTALLATFALYGTAYAQTSTPAEAPVDPVVVKAIKRQKMLDYVRAVAALSSDGQISRRPEPFCPFVAGGPGDVNRYLMSRLRQVGEQAGLPFATKACRPNLLVIFSAEPETMLRKARKAWKVNFSPATPTEVERFMRSARPVRWWHSVVVVPGLVSGETLSAEGDVNGPVMIRSEGTRIIKPTRSVIRGSIVVIDANQVRGVDIGALADYTAFVALTDVQAGAELPGQASILNLFTADEATPKATRLTAIDLAYLYGVYHAREVSYGMNQMGKVATLMQSELEK